MSGKILPLLPSVPNYEFTTTLNNVPYVCAVRWNSRDSAWFMDLLNTDDTPIVQGMKLVLGTIIGARSASELMPGCFVVRDTSNTMRDAGYDDIGEGQRVQVYFFTFDELFTEELVTVAPGDPIITVEVTGSLTATLGALTVSATGTANVQT